jgi:hypothetical protein
MMSSTCGGANGSLFARLGFLVSCPRAKQQKRRKDGAPGTQRRNPPNLKIETRGQS